MILNGRDIALQGIFLDFYSEHIYNENIDRDSLWKEAVKEKPGSVRERRNFMKPYIHKVQYYETDKMGITHHSNYIRWMEEARVDFMEKIGWGYDRMEECGILSPVIGVECKYKKPTTFNDRIRVEIRVESYNGAKLTLKYVMEDIYTEEIVALGESRHCFLTEEGNPVTLWKHFPELDNVLKIGLKSEEEDIEQ